MYAGVADSYHCCTPCRCGASTSWRRARSQSPGKGLMHLGATGRYFVTRFTLGGEVWPGPLDKELKTKRLFPSVRKGKDAPLPYNTHNKRDKELFRKLDIYIMKTTHASTVYAARAGDEAGLSDEVSSFRLLYVCIAELSHSLAGCL